MELYIHEGFVTNVLNKNTRSNVKPSKEHIHLAQLMVMVTLFSRENAKLDILPIIKNRIRARLITIGFFRKIPIIGSWVVSWINNKPIDPARVGTSEATIRRIEEYAGRYFTTSTHSINHLLEMVANQFQYGYHYRINNGSQVIITNHYLAEDVIKRMNV
jgi:hypothetical protein